MPQSPTLGWLSLASFVSMRVTHYSFSRTGGAGRVAGILTENQKKLGIDASFKYSTSTNLWNHPLKNPRLTLAATVDEYLVKSRGVTSLFSLARTSLGNDNLESNPDFSVGVSHLHWIEGVFSYKAISAQLLSGNPVVWTLHDMVAFTGGCHYSLGCRGYEKNCEGCPQVRKPFQKKVSLSLSTKKQAFNESLRNLRLVAPSPWIKQAAESASMFKNQKIELIPNPISHVFFEKVELENRRSHGLDDNHFVVALVADDLSNPIKRVEMFLDLIKHWNSELRTSVKVILIGDGGEIFANHYESAIPLGPQDPWSLARNLSMANVLVSFSGAESAGMTIKEAAALGIPSLTFGVHKDASTIVHNETGLVAESENHFLDLLSELINNPHLGKRLGLAARLEAQLVHNPRAVASKYLDIYQSL